MSGSLAAFGLDPLQAAKMWYEEVNKKGGIHGRKIRVVVEDDKCNPNELGAVVRKFVTVDKVFLINGGVLHRIRRGWSRIREPRKSTVRAIPLTARRFC